MKRFDPTSLSPLPSVNLGSIQLPSHGLLIGRNAYCTKQFAKGTACRDFYRSLTSLNTPQDRPIQCPFGFSAYPFTLGGNRVATTGFVPFPRGGGEAERQRAKAFPETKIAFEAVRRLSQALVAAEDDRIFSIAEQLKKYPSALHEVRKLNRTIKQEAERLCRAQRPNNPDAADASLVSIWKSSELMTYQFGILELIANETLAELPRKTPSEIYRIFDKCARIYELTATDKSLTIDLHGDSPTAMVCDKTFPIVPTVLIENAIKYSVREEVITIRVRAESKENTCKISVSNISPKAPALSDILAKGVRGKSGGLGVGLYLADLVAKQHGSFLVVNREPVGNNYERFTLSFDLATV